jgi:hypothetical protein
MGKLNFKSAIILLIAIPLLPAAYINCSGPTHFAVAEKSSMEGGGDGYSGKLYVMANAGSVCPDGNPYLAQIEMQNDQPYLTREACAVRLPKLVNVLLSSTDSNYLAYDLNVFSEDSILRSVPQAPTVLAAMGMSSSVSPNHVCSGADCWDFENNGSIASTVNFSTAGDYDFTILARADLALGVGANIELRIDGTVVGTATVASTSDAEYKIRATVAPVQHTVEVAFTNDYQDVSTNANRNLYVTSLRIDALGTVTSACLSRAAGALLTLTSAQLPYQNMSLAPNTRVDASAVNYSGTSVSAIKLGAADSCMAGGVITGGWPAGTPWSSLNGTWGVSLNGSNFLLENSRIDNYGDCIGIWNSASGFDIRGAYCTKINGDFVSDKNSWGGTIEDSLFDGGVTFFNDNGSAAAPAGAVVTIRNNLVHLSRFQDTYFGSPGHAWFWKQDTASAVHLSLHGNVFRADESPLTNSQTLDPSTISSCKKADGSPDNVIVWLGPGVYPFQSELDTGCFTLTTDPTVWDQAVAAWKVLHGY